MGGYTTCCDPQDIVGAGKVAYSEPQEGLSARTVVYNEPQQGTLPAGGCRYRKCSLRKATEGYTTCQEGIGTGTIASEKILIGASAIYGILTKFPHVSPNYFTNIII